MTPYGRILLLPLLVSATLLSCSSSEEATTAGLRLPDVDGNTGGVFPVEGARATTVFFAATECPISNYFAPEMERIRKEYGPRGIAFRLVFADPQEDVSLLREHLAGFGVAMLALLDFDHELLDYTGASVTPEAVVLSASGEILYRGRIDDTYVAFGKQRAAPTTRDLRIALDAILDGRLPDPDRTEAIGCFIPSLDGFSLPMEMGGVKSPR